MKIAIIGAGSIVFCKTLLMDIVQIKGLGHIEFALMAPSTRHTSDVKRYFDRVAAANGLDAEAWITTDRREALRNADYVIATLNVGGTDAATLDIEIPLKYGVDQCIGDTNSIGSIFRSMRTLPVMRGLARDMLEVCPNAMLLNYVNPMTAVCRAVDDEFAGKIPYVGLCHGVQTTIRLIAGYLGLPLEEIDYTCAGINHMGWFIKLERNGVDLYPALREKFELPEYYASEKVRGEVFRHFGYFMTESTGHLSEYLPYFRKNEMARSLYCDEPDFGGETGASLKWSKKVKEKYRDRDVLEQEPSTLPPRSIEYGSYIIEATALNRPFTFNGNIRNTASDGRGLITNLPADCIAEMPVIADGEGLHPQSVGALPPQCAALNMTNVNVQTLTFLAEKYSDPKLLVQAAALDPLTGAVCTLKEIREMVTEMLLAEAKWLPNFEGKLPRPTPTIFVPADCKRAEVPADPALAINTRLANL
ncbi:MAG: alpha-glucosidase/alpha-galactosidase [Clostridia bacterium]|nr:alpha-glucosidase/alpha-galactosidase [Clostridia bacterium]